MEAALKSVLAETLSGFVTKGLEQANAASFPLQLHNLELNAKRLNHELDSRGESSIRLEAGKIGKITITPGWMGNVEVKASDVELNVSFSAMKAASNGMKRAMDGNDDDDLAAAIAASLEEAQTQTNQKGTARAPPPVADPCPRKPPAPCANDDQLPPAPPPLNPQGFAPSEHACYCAAHNCSEKRPKTDRVQTNQCMRCGKKVHSTYAKLALCVSCSVTRNQCMICGSSADIPSQQLPNEAPQEFAAAFFANFMPPAQADDANAAWNPGKERQAQSCKRGNHHAQNRAATESPQEGLLDAIIGMLPGGEAWKACCDQHRDFGQRGVVHLPENPHYPVIARMGA